MDASEHRPIYKTRFGEQPFALCVACAAPYTGRSSRDGWGTCPVHAARQTRHWASDPKREAGVTYGKVRSARLRDDMRSHMENAIVSTVTGHRWAADCAQYRENLSERAASEALMYLGMDTRRRIADWAA